MRGRVEGLSATGSKSAGRGLSASVGGVGGSASGVVRTEGEEDSCEGW